MSRSIFIYILFITVLINGCSPATPTATHEPLKTAVPPLQGEWTINMNHSGGIMGVMRSIEISSNGNYTIRDERQKQTISKQLSLGELSKLKEIVSNTDYISAEKPIPSACADCFIYDLEIHGNSKKFSIHVDDFTMPDSGMEALITYLRDLMDRALR